MRSPYNLLPHERVLRDVVGERLPEPHGGPVHVQTGLDERDSGVLQVELISGGKRVIDSAHTECLSHAVECEQKGLGPEARYPS